MASQIGTCLFCFADRDAEVELDGICVRRYPRCSAVICEAAIDDFTTEHLEDPNWVGPRAWWHERVVEAVMSKYTVLPARFGTLFSSIESLDRYVEKHQNRIVELLKKFSGFQEWSVEAIAHPEAVTAEVHVPEQEQKRLRQEPPGKRYLDEKRVKDSVAQQEEQAKYEPLERTARSVAEDLSKIADDRVERKVINDPEKQVLRHWAYLLPPDKVDQFQSRVEAAGREAAPKGLEFKLSGPWPVYSFVPALPPPS